MMSAPIWLSNDFHTGCIFVRQACSGVRVTSVALPLAISCSRSRWLIAAASAFTVWVTSRTMFSSSERSAKGMLVQNSELATSM